jgi:hypothetical protein
MTFDFSLTLSLSSRTTSHTLNHPKELPEMSWIDDEAKRAKTLDDTKKERKELRKTQSPGLWSDLKGHLKTDIEDINKEQYLVEHRLGGLPLDHVDNEGQFKIIKRHLPSIHITLRYMTKYIEVVRETFLNHTGDKHLPEKRTKIYIRLGADNQMYLEDEEKPGGKEKVTYEVSEASQRILTSVLRSEETDDEI